MSLEDEPRSAASGSTLVGRLMAEAVSYAESRPDLLTVLQTGAYPVKPAGTRPAGPVGREVVALVTNLRAYYDGTLEAPSADARRYSQSAARLMHEAGELATRQTHPARADRQTV